MRRGCWGELDSLNLSVLALKSRLHEHGVEEDEHDGAGNEPEEDRQRARDEQHREADDAKRNVQLLLRDDERADLEGSCRSALNGEGLEAHPAPTARQEVGQGIPQDAARKSVGTLTELADGHETTSQESDRDQEHRVREAAC